MNRCAVNLTNNEVEKLLEIVSIFKDIVENKRTDRMSCLKKMVAWKKIEKKFNATFVTDFRSHKVLRTKYENIKRTNKQYHDKMNSSEGQGGNSVSQSSNDGMQAKKCQSSKRDKEEVTVGFWLRKKEILRINSEIKMWNEQHKLEMHKLRDSMIQQKKRHLMEIERLRSDMAHIKELHKIELQKLQQLTS